MSEQSNRERKARKTVAFIISELARVSKANPEMLKDAALGAGWIDLSDETAVRVCEMLDALAAKLAQEREL